MFKINPIIFVSLFFIGCSKEKRYERRITDEWEIVSASYEKEDNHSGQLSGLHSLNQSGDVDFKNDLTGSTLNSIDNPFPNNFSWINTKEKLMISDLDSNWTTEYFIDEFSKTRMYLKFVVPNPYNDQYTIRRYYTLQRKD